MLQKRFLEHRINNDRVTNSTAKIGKSVIQEMLELSHPQQRFRTCGGDLEKFAPQWKIALQYLLSTLRHDDHSKLESHWWVNQGGGKFL